MNKKKIVLVSGNINKVKEFREILGGDFEVENVKLDLDEIQSMSVLDISERKARQAYAVLKRPVVVEDTGFFIDELGGLPGPFIKFFEGNLIVKDQILNPYDVIC